MTSLPIDELIRKLISLKYPDPEKVQDKDIASRMGVSPAAFSNYRLGKRKPETKLAANIAKKWAAEVLEEPKEELRRRLRATFDSTEVTSESLNALFNELLENATDSGTAQTGLNLLKSKIRSSSLTYGVFSGSGDTFFQRFLDRWLKRQLSLEPTTRKSFEIEDDLESGRVHLASCFFASVGRARSARFFPTPLRISLACLCHMRFDEHIAGIATAMSVNQHSLKNRLKLAPIVVRGEVGHFHAIHTLGFTTEELEFGEYDKNDLAERLRVASERANVDGPSARIPVVIVDEYTGFQVLQELKGVGRFALPVTTSLKVRQSRIRREMPDYFMSFACARKDKEFADFLDESLHIFLNTEIETTARAMADTFWNLERQILEAMPYVTWWGTEKPGSTRAYGEQHRPEPLSRAEMLQVARQYCRYTFSLDTVALTSRSTLLSGWYRILNRTREIVNEESISEERIEELRTTIQSLLGSDGTPSRQLRTEKQLIKINRLTDLGFQVDDMLGRYTDDIVDLIDQRCRRVEVRERIPIVKELSGGRALKQTEAWGGITQLLNELRILYCRLDNPMGTRPNAIARESIVSAQTLGQEIADRIERDWEECLERYELVLLAQDEHGGPAGLLCVRTEPGCREDDPVQASGDERDFLKRCCEFRYIWVSESYRGRNVSQFLIGQAIDWCLSQSRFTHVRAAIMPQLGHAVHRLQRHNFRFVSEDRLLRYDRAFTPGRLILQHELDPKLAAPR